MTFVRFYSGSRRSGTFPKCPLPRTETHWKSSIFSASDLQTKHGEGTGPLDRAGRVLAAKRCDPENFTVLVFKDAGISQNIMTSGSFRVL